MQNQCGCKKIFFSSIAEITPEWLPPHLSWNVDKERRVLSDLVSPIPISTVRLPGNRSVPRRDDAKLNLASND